MGLFSKTSFGWRNLAAPGETSTATGRLLVEESRPQVWFDVVLSSEALYLSPARSARLGAAVIRCAWADFAQLNIFDDRVLGKCVILIPREGARLQALEQGSQPEVDAADKIFGSDAAFQCDARLAQAISDSIRQHGGSVENKH